MFAAAGVAWVLVDVCHHVTSERPAVDEEAVPAQIEHDYTDHSVLAKASGSLVA